MGNAAFNIAMGGIGGEGTIIDLDGDDIRMLLLKVAPTFPGDLDVDNITDLLAGSADEADATNYVRKALALTTVTDDTDNRGEVTSGGTTTWTALGGASNNDIVGAVVYKHVTNDGDSIPIAYIELTDTPTNGGDFSVSFSGNLMFTITGPDGS